MKILAGAFGSPPEPTNPKHPPCLFPPAGLDELMRDAHRGRFDAVLVWACDRIVRSTRHFLEVLDELNRLQIEFVSFREQIDTGGPLGRAITIIVGVGAVAELERGLIAERVRAGMRRARLEGRPIGRRPLDLNREAIFRNTPFEKRSRMSNDGRVCRSYSSGTMDGIPHSS